MRPVAIIFSAIALLSAKASEPVDSLLGVMAGAAGGEAYAKARVSGGEWSLIWSRADSANFCRATFSMPDMRHVDGAYTPKCRVAVSQVADGAETSLLTAEVPAMEPALSVRLIADAYGARLYAGSGRLTEVGRNFPAPAGEVRIEAAGADCIERCIFSATQPYAPEIVTADIDSAICAAASPCVGRWEYLDRDIDSDRASYSGIRSIAIIPAPEGGAYSVVYLSGLSPRWQPMQLKATLTPTIFAGNYDVQWTDSFGVKLADDNYAQLSMEGNVITFFFPVYKSQIRFKKARKDTH